MVRMATLRREVGMVGAIGLGLGSILGTGVFVALAIAAGEAGAWLPLAVLLGGVVATFNGLSSAQLAAVHPVAGGTYAYGRRFLSPYLGFVAGVTFLAAKSASAATAALGVAGYVTLVLGVSASWRIPLALIAVVVLAWLVDRGVRRSSLVNLLLVSVTLLGLATFVVVGSLAAGGVAGWTVSMPVAMPVGETSSGAVTLHGVLFATALAFVAYTGYGRVATMGEEVHDPRRTIPRAVVATLVVSAVTYLAVTLVAMATVGPAGLAASVEGVGAPLARVADAFLGPAWGPTAVQVVLAIAAVTAMLGVLLNLLLGLSRVVFAMARDGEAPARFARLDATGTTPRAAVLVVALVIAGLAATGDVRVTWRFSAVSVLLYYALANLSALRVREGRFLPRWVSLAGLVSCLGLAVFVPLPAWVGVGALLLVVTIVRWGVRLRR